MDPNEGGPTPGSVGYEPVPVKDLLVEMKDTAELLIDLAYSAVLHDGGVIADEVLRLERRMDILELRARMSLLMAARSPTDAETLTPVLGIVSATGQISDATADVAAIVHDEVGLPEALRTAIPDAVETVARGVVDADSPYAGRTLGGIDLESDTGVRLVAIRRGDDWIHDPGPEAIVEPTDVAFLRGAEEALGGVYERLTGERYDPPATPAPEIADLDRAVTTIVLMKDLSELAVDLAYGSVLFDDPELAEEVRTVEVEVDALYERLEAWTLRAARDVDDPISLRGLLRIGAATEAISDAALVISEGILRGIDVHPVVELAVGESEEVIVRAVIEDGSDLVGVKLDDGKPVDGPRVTIGAIRRPGEGWLLSPATTLQAGDVAIAKGTQAATGAFGERARR